jgi:uncharacterized membrane protein
VSYIAEAGCAALDGCLLAVLSYGLGSLLGFILRLIQNALWLFWAFLMYKAYNGERYRIPWLADTVDSFAGTPAA